MDETGLPRLTDAKIARPAEDNIRPNTGMEVPAGTFHIDAPRLLRHAVIIIDPPDPSGLPDAGFEFCW